MVIYAMLSTAHRRYIRSIRSTHYCSGDSSDPHQLPISTDGQHNHDRLASFENDHVSSTRQVQNPAGAPPNIRDRDVLGGVPMRAHYCR